MSGEEIGRDVDALQAAGGEERLAVFLDLQNFQGLADFRRRGDLQRGGFFKQELAFRFVGRT